MNWRIKTKDQKIIEGSFSDGSWLKLKQSRPYIVSMSIFNEQGEGWIDSGSSGYYLCNKISVIFEPGRIQDNLYGIGHWKISEPNFVKVIWYREDMSVDHTEAKPFNKCECFMILNGLDKPTISSS